MNNKLKTKIKKLILFIVIIAVLITAIFVCINNFSKQDKKVANNLFTTEYIKAGAEGKFGLIDKEGKVVMPFKYDDVVFDDESQIAAIMIDGKWGFSDKNGNIKVKAEYDQVGKFAKSTLAPVMKEDLLVTDLLL